MRLISEFAAVEIARDDRGNGPRLMIRDLQTGQEIYLDPMELAALAWTRHEDLLPLLDPGRFERGVHGSATHPREDENGV